MQRLTAMVAALVTILPAAAAAQGSFEGRVTAEMSGQPNRPGMDIVVMTKGGKGRVDMSAQGMPMYMLMDLEGDALTMVMPAQQMFMRTDLKQMEQQMGSSSRAPQPPPKFTRTGRTETIAGHDCEHVVFEMDGGKQLDVCAAKGLGFFGGPAGGGMMGGGRGGARIPAAYQQLVKEFKEGFFPLRMEMVEGTQRTQVFLVKKIERQALDAGLFEVPAGFQEMTMPGMPGRP